MVYNDGSVGINSVRMETGNILPADFPDAEIILNLENAYSKVQLNCNRNLTTPFLPTDTEYGLARETEKQEAAKNCLKPYGPEFRDKIQELEAEVNANLAFLKANLQNVVATPGSAVTPYVYTPAPLTYPKNPDAPVYRSIKGGSSSTIPGIYE